MNAMRKITVEIPEAIAARMDAEVAAGRYADTADLVTDSLWARLNDHSIDQADPEVERWLREAVLPTLERMERDGPAGLASEEVFGGVRERYLARTNGA